MENLKEVILNYLNELGLYRDFISYLREHNEQELYNQLKDE